MGRFFFAYFSAGVVSEEMVVGIIVLERWRLQVAAMNKC